jgi:hypothetical protein
MMICPRCGSNNDSGRAACWNCYAPLQGALASRVKPMVLAGKGSVPAPEAALVASGEPEPAPEPPKKRGLFGKK